MITNVHKDKLKVEHILKADPFGQIIQITDKNHKFKNQKLVENANEFFKNIYCDEGGEFTIGNNTYNTTLRKWIEKEELQDPSNCMLFLVRGYAGCGKSTFVQSVLYNIFEGDDYEYCYYNYDVGSHNTNIKESYEVNSAIIYNLTSQMSLIVKHENGKKYFDVFFQLLCDNSTIRYLDRTQQIRENFVSTITIKDTTLKIFLNNNYENPEAVNEFENVFAQQLKQLSTYQLLCVDYLWRLAQYIVSPNSAKKYMCVCYDNLDCIFNYDLLYSLIESIIVFRHNLNDYISNLNNLIQADDTGLGQILSKNISFIPMFTVFTTYRKITAIRVSLENSEMINDVMINDEFVKNIELSKYYNFSKISEQRLKHFKLKIKTNDLCSNTTELNRQITMLFALKDMGFIKNKYSGLWNNNFRSCSNVLGKIIENDEKDVKSCIKIFNKKFDGYNEYRSCYHGASGVFLHDVCKLMVREGICNSDHLDLINLTTTDKRKTAFSRVLLTYIYNSIEPVSITEIMDVFEKVFEPRYICKILGQMITRTTNEMWRRPLFYSKNALKNENSIEEQLFEQYKKYKKNEKYDYTCFSICECGKTFIDVIVPNFEFYSVRMDINNLPLYCVSKVEYLAEIIEPIYNKVSECCKRQNEFCNLYIDKYNLSIEEYLNLKFHPKTNNGNYQLHIERVIFSHIDYLNECRIYNVQLHKEDKILAEKFHNLLLGYCKKYIDLYFEYILTISSDRQAIANLIRNKIEKAELQGTEANIEI